MAVAPIYNTILVESDTGGVPRHVSRSGAYCYRRIKQFFLSGCLLVRHGAIHDMLRDRLCYTLLSS